MCGAREEASTVVDEGRSRGDSDCEVGTYVRNIYQVYIYIRYSSCRYNKRQLIEVTVVRRVRPRAGRWCDCEGHRRWK